MTAHVYSTQLVAESATSCTYLVRYANGVTRVVSYAKVPA